MNNPTTVVAVEVLGGYYLMLPDGTSESVDHERSIDVVIRNWFLRNGNPNGTALIDWK